METERLRLRRLEAKDAVRLAEYRSDGAVARYQSWESMTVEEAEAFIRALPRRLLAGVDEWSQMAISDKTTDEIIGDIGLCKRASGDAVELGITLSPAAQGRGLATEACRAVIDFVFSFSEVVTLQAVVDSRNAAAIALMRRLGMDFHHSAIAEFKNAPCTEVHFILHRSVEGAVQ